jgi:endoglucanase
MLALLSTSMLVIQIGLAPMIWPDVCKMLGISKADGFALNVSNFFSTQDNITYGNQLSQKLGGKHFVIDTARNGNGPTGDNQWCNPSGRALGVRDTTATGNAAVDAFLWLKNPGESDGNCNGGPSAGVWWPDYALGLAQRASL